MESSESIQSNFVLGLVTIMDVDVYMKNNGHSFFAQNQAFQYENEAFALRPYQKPASCAYSLKSLYDLYGNQERIALEAGLTAEIAKLLCTIKEREAKIIVMRFWYGLTFEQMSVVLGGISRARVWQIYNLAIRKLRHKSRAYKLKPFVDKDLTKHLK